MSRPALAIALPFMLGACTTMYPPLYSAPTIAGTARTGEPPIFGDCRDPSDPLAQTVACAQILQDVYSTGYAQSARWQDISQLPIIGAAGVAAWILLKDKPNAARKVGKIGIGAGVYAAGRGQLLPAGIPEVFIKGHSALGCVLAEEIYFNGTKATQAAGLLDRALIDAASLAVATTRLRYQEPSDPAASPDLLKAARTLADQTIAGANTQLGASRQERAAYQFAASPFRQSVGDIAAWVASKGRARPNASYDDLSKGMSSSPGPAETGSSSSQLLVDLNANVENVPSALLIDKLAAASQGLTEATSDLRGRTPAYGARITRVGKCATDLPSG